MRKLLIMRGAPGVGKSTLIKKHNMEHYTLASDTFRMILQSPVLTLDGSFGVSQSYGREDAWHLLYVALEKRMQNGDFVIVDATHSKLSDMLTYKALADKYRYKIVVVDFTSIPLEVALKRNREREEYKRIPEAHIEKCFMRFKSQRIPADMDVVDYEHFDDVLTLQPIDYSFYKKVHHIGDIHGSYQVLMEYLKDGIKDDELYIFLGDYIDRGLENAKVLSFLLSIRHKQNVVLLEGNHEKYLWNWANNETARSSVFETQTRIELEKNQISRKEVQCFCRGLKEAVYYRYEGKEVLVTHGGLPSFPSNLNWVSADQLIKGVGDYQTQIDEFFDKNEQNTLHYQIHGHRNFFLKPTNAYQHSFNLEGAVERGGELRSAVLTKEGFSFVSLKNTVYKPVEEKAI
ncbi:metallophosphoesterase (plasmid) [Aneurinibacillus sp. Ricciae_BoGa-3]|uniref:serine/threonine protein phosphatase n=1 Tax=Aneurinibacillus sp. Ricciae_BoGa-3 TaxID=3022697 RepID=UPI002340A0BB|nr:serine/threonine protein phosphatase [Aneurinibacillus sp. Ricciae_BoGa-3]WCK57661.1 metallophosphoesterase [Aneurinibacillus sp. Ricciae_BoGa-3]